MRCERMCSRARFFTLLVAFYSVSAARHKSSSDVAALMGETGKTVRKLGNTLKLLAVDFGPSSAKSHEGILGVLQLACVFVSVCVLSWMGVSFDYCQMSF